jgi:hypothetical protein
MKIGKRSEAIKKISGELGTQDPDQQLARIQQLKGPVVAVTVLADYRNGTVRISASPAADYNMVNEILTTAMQELRAQELQELAQRSAGGPLPARPKADQAPGGQPASVISDAEIETELTDIMQMLKPGPDGNPADLQFIPGDTDLERVPQAGGHVDSLEPLGS